MDIDYSKVTAIQNPLLIGQQKPLDIRIYVNTLTEVDTIQNPYIGLMFYCNEDGEYYKVTGLKDGYYYLDDKFIYPSKKNANDAEYEQYIQYSDALVKSYEKLVHGGSSSSGGSGGGTNPDPDVPGTEDPVIPIDPTTKYSITYNLTNVTASNTSKTISKGTSYYTKLTAKAGYELSSVTVTMGGEDVTTKHYKDGVINISQVSGDIVITALASAEGGGQEPTQKYYVSYYLINFTSQNNPQGASRVPIEGTSFTDTLRMTSDTNANPIVTVTMNGITKTYKDGTVNINISPVTGNISIMASSVIESDYQPPEGEPDNYPSIWQDEETNDDYIWNYTIPNPNGIKYRELIGYLAACVCCNAFYSNTRENGKPFIKFKPLYQSRTFGTLKSRYYKEFKRERSAFVVKQVVVDTGSMNFYTQEAGATDDERVLVKIPFGTQDICDYIGAKLIGLEPWGYNLKLLGNPQYEYGDKFNVIDLEGNPFTVICYTSKLTYNGGLSHDMSGVKLKPGNITNSYLEEKIKNDIEVSQDDIKDNIAALQQVAKDLKDNADNNEHTIGNVSGSVNNLKSDVKNLKTTVYDDHERRIDKLEKDIDGLTGSGSGSLSGKVKELDEKINGTPLKDGLETRVDKLDTKVGDLEDEVNGTILVDGLKQKVKDLEDLVKTLSDRITALENQNPVNPDPGNPNPENPGN